MGILDLKEHTTCYNYMSCAREGFLYHQFQTGELNEETNEVDCIFFILEGELEIFSNGKAVSLTSGNMSCFSRRSIYRIHSPVKSNVVIAQFDNTIQGCEKISFSQLCDLGFKAKDEICPLEIRQSMKLFLEHLIRYLGDGAGCVHFHEIKLKELFWNIRFYYTKKEQASFFYPILGKDYDFKKKVLNNYKKARTIKELAGLCDSSLSSFKRKFLKEFREPAGSWLQKQINGMIKHRLEDENIPIGIIAMELNFSSQPQFCRYCKKNLGYTPGEWRKLLRNRNKDIKIAGEEAVLDKKDKKKTRIDN